MFGFRIMVTALRLVFGLQGLEAGESGLQSPNCVPKPEDEHFLQANLQLHLTEVSCSGKLSSFFLIFSFCLQRLLLKVCGSTFHIH